MRRRVVFVAVLIVLPLRVWTATQQRDGGDMLARIRAEGLQRSRALALYRTVTDEFGARLTGSPAHVRAANWARDRFMEWGLTNPHLEPYEFGRGWELEHISVEMTEPRYFPFIAYGEAWTPSSRVCSAPAPI
jgi:carboxypeptidase Q